MQTSLPPPTLASLLGKLARPNRRATKRYPGPATDRQPLHTVYGGAHLFKATTAAKLGALALAHLHEYAPDARSLSDALGLEGGASLAEAVHSRIVAKLEREPIEDFRIDFEDGFGLRPGAEEDTEAERVAVQVALGMLEGSLPPSLGLRVKNLGEEHQGRAVRTLDIFLTTLLLRTEGKLPDGFVVTLPKVASVGQLKAFVHVLEELEKATHLPLGALKLELMVELPQTLFDGNGRPQLTRLAKAAKGRCVAAHFGTYDYTAACGITAAHQEMTHPACEFAKQWMLAAFSGTAVRVADGATHVLPVPPHRGASLSPVQLAENRSVVHAAWRMHYGNVRHSLAGGFYQGWDLHPGQLVARYAASFAFFLEGLDTAILRLENFLDNATRASLLGNVFDDAATGQGLLNYFLRAHGSGALGPAELARTSLTTTELRERSFLKILANRRPL